VIVEQAEFFVGIVKDEMDGAVAEIGYVFPSIPVARMAYVEFLLEDVHTLTMANGKVLTAAELLVSDALVFLVEEEAVVALANAGFHDDLDPTTKVDDGKFVVTYLEIGDRLLDEFYAAGEEEFVNGEWGRGHIEDYFESLDPLPRHLCHAPLCRILQSASSCTSFVV
jgi:hypothetical protein